MNERIFVIEDDENIRNLLKIALSGFLYEPVTFETAEEALNIAKTKQFDLVVLDLNLPGIDGFEFLTLFRKEHSTPVMIMSARDSDEDIIAGLGNGADEFVTKPFSPRVFAARVRAMIRREQNSAAEGERTVRFGDFTLYETTCILKKGAERVYLSVKEYEVLDYLVHNPGVPLQPETIYKSVWKNAYGDLSAVAVYIQRLRKKIESNPSAPEYIETVFGMGYRFNPEPAADADNK